jgi:hypothetical protein
MSQLQVIELDNSKIVLGGIDIHINSNQSISSNQYIKIIKDKESHYSKIIELNETTATIENISHYKITNLEEWIFQMTNSTDSVIHNPLILGNQVNIFGEVIDNKTLYSLSAKTKVSTKILDNDFYLSATESIKPEFVFFGIYIDNNLKSLIELQTNNAKNYTYINLTPGQTNNQNGIKFLKVLEKFNLKKKNLFLEIEGANNIDVIMDYVEYFKNSLNQYSLIIINANDWSDSALFEIIWALGKTPKLILLNSQQERKIKHFCSAIIGDNQRD